MSLEESTNGESPEQESPAKICKSDAGFMARFAAHAIDMSILGAAVLVLSKIILWQSPSFFFDFIESTFSGKFHSINVATIVCPWVVIFGFYSLINLLPGCAYFLFLESSDRKASLGQALVGLVVVNADSNPITKFQSLARLVVRGAPTILLLAVIALSYFVGPVDKQGATLFLSAYANCLVLISIYSFIVLFRSDRQTLHDLVTDTFVVRSALYSKSRLIACTVLGLVGGSLVFVPPYLYARQDVSAKLVISSNAVDEESPADVAPTRPTDHIGYVEWHGSRVALRSARSDWRADLSELTVYLYVEKDAQIDEPQDSNKHSIAQLRFKFQPEILKDQEMVLGEYEVSIRDSISGKTESWSSSLAPDKFSLRAGLFTDETVDLLFEKKFRGGAYLFVDFKQIPIASVVHMQDIPFLERLPKNAIGRVMVSRVDALLSDSVALLSEAGDRISIGLYEQPLTPGQRESVIAAQNIQSPVEGIRPIVALILRVSSGSQQGSPVIHSFSIYLRRAAIGRFYFKGDSDVISYTESDPDKISKIVQKFSGRLIKGEKINLRFYSDKTIGELPVKVGISGPVLVN